MAKKKDTRLAKVGVSGYNKPKRTPSHSTKSHVVVAKEGDKVNLEFDVIGKYVVKYLAKMNKK